MKKIKFIITSSVALSIFLVGATVYGASSADSIAQKYGYPTVTSLLAVEAMHFTPQWEQNVKGYNSNDGATYTYNSKHFATPSTARKLASWFGGTVIPQHYATGGPFTIPIGAAIKIGDTYLNAGSVAEKLRRLQITYTEEVKSYERNLLENEAIFSSGNKSIPIDPLVRLKTAFGISGDSSTNPSYSSGSGGTTGGDSTNRTIGDCVGRGCPSGGTTTSGSTGGTTGTNVVNSSTFQSNTATANYVRALTQLVNKLIVEAKAKLELSTSGVSTSEQYNPNNITDAPSKNTTTSNATTGSTPAQNNINTTTAATLANQKCTGDIYRDLEAAKTCAALAQSQGAALGYNISCGASKVTLPGSTPGADYYISSICTVNGSAGHGAYMLAGFDPGTSGYVGVNSGWKILETELGN